MSLDPAASAKSKENDDEKLHSCQKASQSYSKMFIVGRELCFLLLIVFTTYASFNSNIGSAPAPAPFFSQGSLVADYYRGELEAALVRASEGDISFIMYYAPWDADSQATRRHFDTVASQHYQQVYFAGINCWQPKSDCRKTLDKIQQFPKLVAYLTHETGVEYRGPRDHRYMSAFLEGMMRPLHRIHGPADLVNLRSAYNVVVVAYLNFQGMRGGMPYRAMYETALKFLERDVRQEIALAVVTSFKTTMEMGVDRSPCIKLYLWNETLDYSGHFSADQLTDWVTSRLHQVSLWLSPPGVKSLTLAPYVTQGPALVMFTPLENFVMYDMLREVGLEYYNCNNSSEISQLAQNISNFVSERISRARRTSLTCQSRGSDYAPTVQVLNNVWINSSCGKLRALPQCSGHVGSCLGIQKNTLSSVMTPEPDPLSASSLVDWVWRRGCQLLLPPPSRPTATPLAPTVKGLACTQNRSVSLLAMDSALFAHFARGLGLDTMDKDRTRVVLLNSQMETTHVLDGSVTRASLSQFLVDFVQGKLERFQRSQTSCSSSPELTPVVSVIELTTETFIPVAFNDSVNVVVMFHSPYCAFCHAVGHVYLTTAQILRHVPTLVFTRVDGENNDLPWQFTAPQYPSVLFFPARRKAESRVFAGRNGITVEALTQFVLSNLPLELRLVAMLQLCQRYSDNQFSARRKECLVDIRMEVLEAISDHLRRYRSISLRLQPSKQRRTAQRQVLTRLQHLKQLQFALSLDSTRISDFVSQFVPDSVSEQRLAKDEL
uniref:Thioredoxin domain-containing protein n=1 Tax=Cuerna arida TaxID=1464854 RepID=A0A1B6GIQ7_9HEMI